LHRAMASLALRILGLAATASLLSQIGAQRREILDKQHSEICLLHGGTDG
jgi:hypothetical protein